MNISGIGLVDWRRTTSIEQMLDTMPEPEHSDQRGLDNFKWENPTRIHPCLKEQIAQQWEAAFKEATGDDYEKAMFFFSTEGRRARGKI